jgi:hypothetical protein
MKYLQEIVDIEGLGAIIRVLTARVSVLKNDL